MKRITSLFIGWRFRFTMVTAIVFLFAGMGEREEIRPDVLNLQDAGSLTGHFVALRDDVIVFFTLGGEVRLPENRVDSVLRSSDGESELYLGTGFLKRGVLDSAEEWLREAQKFPAWEDAAERALAEIESARQREEEERQEAKRKQLATLIFEGNYDQGLRAIERWSSGEEDQWAGQRGRIHMILARNAVDHVNYRRADYHLQQAERAGVSGSEWQRLRDEVDHRRRTKRPSVREEEPPPPFRQEPLTAIRQIEESLGCDVDDRLIRLAQEHASTAGIDPLLVCAVIQAESAWDPNAKSPKGAKGLMQLMPVTAKEMGVSNPMDPSENIRGGANYLRGLLDLYGVSDPGDPAKDKNLNLALGAYNAGPARIAKYKGLPPYKETRTYVKRVTELYQKLKSMATESTPS
ncbi:MAG: lytic transglycosylase domain-containing protein [bacterium]